MREVSTPRAIFRRDLIGNPCAQALDLTREQVRQRMLAQRDLNFHPWIRVTAEYLDDPCYRLCVLRGLCNDFGGDHLTRLRTSRLVGRYEKVMANAPVLRGNQQNPVFAMQPANHALLSALQDFHHLALRPSPPVGAADATNGPIAMQELMHLLWSEEEIRTAIIPHEEAESVRVTLHAPAHEVELGHDADCPAPVPHDLAFPLHCGESSCEALSPMRIDAQQTFKLLLRYRYALVSELLEDRFPGGHVITMARGTFAALAPDAVRARSARMLCACSALIHLIKRAPWAKIAPSRPGGGIGRRTRFRSWRQQWCGGSNPFLGTTLSILNFEC